MNQARKSNPGLCYFLIFAGLFCLLSTLILSLFFKDTLKEKIEGNSQLEDRSLAFEIDSIDQQIQFKEQEIKIVKLKLDAEQSLQEAREKLNAIKGSKNVAISAASNSERTQAEKTKELEQEKTQLLAKKAALVKRMEEKHVAGKTWRQWFEDYNIRFLLAAIVPLGLFGFFLMRLTFFGVLPRRNPFSLTDFERRCVLFLPLAIVISIFGFALFVWALTITA